MKEHVLKFVAAAGASAYCIATVAQVPQSAQPTQTAPAVGTQGDRSPRLERRRIRAVLPAPVQSPPVELRAPSLDLPASLPPTVIAAPQVTTAPNQDGSRITSFVQAPRSTSVSLNFGGQSFGANSGVVVRGNPSWTTGGYSVGKDRGSLRYDPKTGRYMRISPRRDPALSSHYDPKEFEEDVPANVAAKPVSTGINSPDPWERAAAHFNARRFAQAEKALEGLVKDDSEDLDARVWLGMAMVFEKKFEDGANWIADAYREDPTLASDALSFADLPGVSAQDLKTTQAALVNRGGIAKSADCYMAAAVLAQARAKPAEAVELVKKARELGLDAVFTGQLVQRFGG